MKISVMGAGAVGSYYGGLLARAGQDVTLITRGPHLHAMREKGLKINSFFGDFEVSSIQATDDPTKVGPVDLILFTVKTYDTDSATEAMSPMIGSNTSVVPLQNANMAERIGRDVGMEHMLGGLTYVYTAREAPGLIRQTSNFHRIVFGEFSGRITPRAEAIRKTLETSGATIILTDDIQKELWSKLLFISPSAGVSSIARLPSGHYRSVPETRALLIEAMSEIEAIARARGVKLDSDIVEQKIKLIDSLEPGAMTSTQRDVMAGRPSEMEELIGMIVIMGKELNLPTPASRFMYAALKPVELKARQVG